MIHRDIAYGSEELQNLDLYVPDGGSNSKIIMYIHGGLWSYGDKQKAKRHGEFFANHGFLFVAINYRLSPAVKHPAHVQDCAQALAWIQTHISEYGGKPDAIFLMGHSSGAHLAALMCTDERYLHAHSLSPENVSGVICLDSAQYSIPIVYQSPEAHSFCKTLDYIFGDMEGMWQASPSSYIKKGKPYPHWCLLVSKYRAGAIRINQGFRNALNDAGAKTELHIIEADHEGINALAAQEASAVTKVILDFV